MLKLLRDDDVDINKWKRLMSQTKYLSPFQTPEFYSFFNSLIEYSANVFAVEENDSYSSLVIVTIHMEIGIKSYFSKRGIIYGGFLISDKDKNSLNFLLKNINNYYHKKLIYLESRNNFDFSYYNKIFHKNRWLYSNHLNVMIGLDNYSFEEIFSRLKYNRRREIKLSYNEGATVNEAKGIDEINLLYIILKDLYKNRVKLPLPKLSYFQNLYNNKIGKVFIVKHDGIVIGGAFCFTYKKNSIHTIYYAGNRKYNKRIFPTHLAIIGVIKYAIKNNIKVVDLMGAGKPDKAYGVRNYKLAFGGDLAEHGRFINILNPILYKLGKIGIKLLSKYN